MCNYAIFVQKISIGNPHHASLIQDTWTLHLYIGYGQILHH